MSDVDAQYERIVRMIPVDALQSSYNSVIQDGISSVNDAVDGVVAALSHVKEVRDAVDKLGQDKPQRNNNLLNTMEKTMALQRELESVLQKMIQLRMMTQMSVAERRHQLPDVLAKLTDIVVVSKKQEQLSMLKYVLLWATLSAGKGDDMKAYDRFCKDMTAIISRSPEGGRKAGLERLVNKL
eukprot:jgi/Phyca11/105214/e_gw1.10.548.1